MNLAELTTLRVGGAAREMLSASTPAELVQQTIDTWASEEPWLLVGGGSNLLVADEGFDGTVIRVLTRGIERIGESGSVQSETAGGSDGGDTDGGGADGSGTLLRVQAGEPWDAVVAFAVENGLAGIEALSGIPGSIGAAPVQNIGAYGQELSEVLVAIDFLEYLTGERSRIPAEKLELGYRSSSLKQGRSGVVIAVELRLEASEASRPIAYAQLANALGVAIGDTAPLRDVRAAVLRLRAAKGMLLSPGDPDSVSAGSFFTNPIVGENFARALPPEAPRWLLDPEAPASAVKLSAAWLIEHSGIRRGFSLPGSRAAISSKHTLALVNTGGALAEDVAELARYVQLRVLSQFGVRLQPEPQLVGVQL